MYDFIWERLDWTAFTWDAAAVGAALGKARHAQGLITGEFSVLGFTERRERLLGALSQEVRQTADIEGESWDMALVRSSVARRLGMEEGLLLPADRRVDGLVEVVLDAMGDWRGPLTEERLLGWHRSLFPKSGDRRSIAVGAWRDDSAGPMRVISGPMGREKEHFRAPPASRVQTEMDAFLGWLAEPGLPDPLLVAALAHFRFVTIHPFGDGNGRIARAIAERCISRAEGTGERFYSVSAQIRRERAAYYEILESSQRGGPDLSEWILWFLSTVEASVSHARSEATVVLAKAAFWRSHRGKDLNQRQSDMLNRLLDGFEGRLTSSKWAALAHCSQDSAGRDINDLLVKGLLRKGSGGGRSTWYELA